MAAKKILIFFLVFIPFVIPCSSFIPSKTDLRVEIYNLRSFTHPSYTRIVVDIGQLREYTYNKLTAPDRVYVDIYQAKLNPILHGKQFIVNNGYIQQIRIAQKSPSTVRVVMDLDFKKTKRYNIFHLFDPFRIVIDIYPKTPVSQPATEKVSQPAQPTKDGYSMARQLGLGIQRVVLDPGHGGTDPGCIGTHGIKEKDLVLDISLRLKELLQKNANLDVILTRESDLYVPLENRTIIANQKQADLYISIHGNANRNPKHSGIETFFLNFSKDRHVNEIAARENATSTKNIGEMKEIILKIVQNSKIVESMELANMIQKNLVSCLSQKHKNVKNLGVKGGPFWVLIGAEMPSVLIEVSHLSNPTEELRLKTPGYRQEIAQGIYNGIINYVHSLGKG